MSWVDGDRLTTANVRNKENAPVFNVKDEDYGATGDGTTDDGGAFNTAIDAVSTAGGVVYVPPGAYNLASTVSFGSKDSIVVQFAKGAVLSSATTSIPSPTGVADAWSGVYGYSGRIEDVHNDPSGPGGYGLGMWLSVHTNSTSTHREVATESMYRSFIYLAGPNGTGGPQTELRQYGAFDPGTGGAKAFYNVYTSRGSIGSPTTIHPAGSGNEPMWRFNVFGHDGTDYQLSGSISFVAVGTPDGNNGGIPTRISFRTADNSNSSEHWYLNQDGSWRNVSETGSLVAQTGALATSDATGHFYIPTCAGVPTGTPRSFSGTVALIYDTSNEDLYVYNGSWRKVTLA